MRSEHLVEPEPLPLPDPNPEPEPLPLTEQPREPFTDLKPVRKAFKSIGYRLRTTRYYDFIGVDILHPDGQRLSKILTREEYDKFKPAIDLREKYKGKVFEGEMRCVL